MVFYIKHGSKIVLYNEDRLALEDTQAKMPQYTDDKIKSSSKNIVEYKGAFYFDDDKDYKALIEADETERIHELFMTRSDFFDGTIKAWGQDGDDLLPVIEGLINSLNITDLEKKIAINNYKNALNFYRKHTLFTLLSNVPIPIGGATVQITAEQWDKFFDETAKRNPDAYKELLPVQ